jgi:peptide/nickel transport system substrate-binding protein
MIGDDRPLPGQTEGIEDVHIRTFLIADVRGYTLFTQERGDEAAAKLAAKFADIARDGVEARGGTLLELRGDEALCVFASTREAIRAAVELQQRFVEETVEVPDLPLTVGIGLDAGEAVPVQGGYRGGALNLAARLCGQASAGEILASREVTHLARRVDGVRYEDRGTLSLKGLADVVAVVRVVPEGEDPAERLRPFAPSPPPKGRKLSRRWAIVVAVAVILALVAISIPLLTSDDPATVYVGTNSVARMNAEDGSLELATELGERPGASAIGFGSLWVAQPDRGVVARLNLGDGSVTDTIRVGSAPSGVAVGEGSVWVTNAADGTVSRINVETNEVTQTLRAGLGPSGIAVGDGALWVADTISAELLRLDPTTGESQAVALASQPTGVAFTPDGVWVSIAPNSVTRVDPADPSVTLTQTVGSGPTAILPAFGSIWVACHIDGTVSRLEPSTGRVQATIQVGDGPNALAAAAGSMWIANEFDGSIVAVDPATDAVEQSVRVGSAATSLVVDGNGLWLAVGASPTEHRGGTLTVSSEAEASASLDPALNVGEGWQILSITNDGLLAHRKVGGPGGATLVPDLAAALPQVSADGLTYRFPLRDGIHYSTGEPVRPEDFRHALERTLSLDSEWAYLYSAIDGAKACGEGPSTCDLSESIVVDEEAVTFHLAQADPDLPFKLALPPAFPVPVATPIADQGLDPLPATGPYMIVEAGADGLEIVRNPEFDEWSGAAQPDGFVDAISWRFDEGVATAFDRLSAGELDWMAGTPKAEDLASLQTAHPDQMVFEPLPATIYVGFDLDTPPFDDARVRKAINYAIDRDHVVELLGAADYLPTCQVLPPNVQGFEPFCPYTLEPDSGVWSAPDLDRAQALIEDSGAVGERVTVWVSGADLPGGVEAMGYVVGVMDELGLRATLKTVDDLDEYGGAVYAGDAQTYLFGWLSVYPGAGDFIPPQFACGAPFNASGMCDKSLDAAIDEAQRLQATDPAAANSAWIEIEHRLVEDAVWAPLANVGSTYAFSARTENVQVHPQWGILLSRLWVQ